MLSLHTFKSVVHGEWCFFEKIRWKLWVPVEIAKGYCQDKIWFSRRTIFITKYRSLTVVIYSKSLQLWILHPRICGRVQGMVVFLPYRRGEEMYILYIYTPHIRGSDAIHWYIYTIYVADPYSNRTIFQGGENLFPCKQCLMVCTINLWSLRKNT